MNQRNLDPAFRDFLGTLNVQQSTMDLILGARNIIRNHLRIEIPKMSLQDGNIPVTPRFMPQGSVVYQTQNMPEYPPDQQLDYDDGCYLPFSYHESENHPKVAANDFFAMVDESLDRLVKTQGWKRVDTSKPTCSRIVLTNEIHIDIPLYSVPDKEFNTIVEAQLKIAKSFTEANDMHRDGEAAPKRQLTWNDLPTQSVLLAHRKNGWIVSDPRKLNKYFVEKLNLYPTARRVSRYLKAWRDHQWPKGGGPSSIYLMTIVDVALREVPKISDSHALLQTLRKLKEIIEPDLRNPTEEKEVLRISDEDKQELINRVGGFYLALLRAMDANHTTESINACKDMQIHLGKRFPLVDSLPVERKESVFISQRSNASPIPNTRTPPTITRAG